MYRFQCANQASRHEDVSLCLINHYAMKAYGWVVRVELHAFVTLTLVGCEWSASRSIHFYTWGKNPRLHVG
jgi:hypothetical protein